MDSQRLFSIFARELSDRISKQLPGTTAQMRMVPAFRKSVPLFPERVPDSKEAAILALFFPSGHRGEPAELLLTVRPEGMSEHAGQVAFPGGRRDDGETLETTALRETEEEVAVSSTSIRIAGTLTPIYIPPSNFFVHPFVGFTPEPPDLTFTSEEVARMFSVPVTHLIDPSVERVATRTWKSESHQIPFLALNGEFVWGATAMMLAELISVIRTLPLIAESGQTPS